MNCKTCGSPLTENDQFCKNCGAAVTAQDTQNVVPQQSIPEPPATPEPVSVPPEAIPEAVQQVPPTVTPEAVQQVPPAVNPEPVQVQPVPAPVNNMAPAAQPNMNQAQPAPAPKQNNGIKYIVIGVVLVVAIFAGLYIFNSMNKKPTVVEPDTPTGTVVSTKSYKVNFKGFVLTIPDNFVYQEKNGTLFIGDEEGTWATQIGIEQGSYQQLKSNISQLPSVLQKNGYTSSAAVEKTLGGVEYITMEATMSGQNAIVSLTRANAMYFMQVIAYNQDNDYDYKILETVAPIISSVEPASTPTNNMDSNAIIDLSGLGEFAQ